MSQTFDQLGIPFPLFEAPVEEAQEYCGPAKCAVCQCESLHCFQLGIGCNLMVPCPECGTVTGLDADDSPLGRLRQRTATACCSCNKTIPFPIPETFNSGNPNLRPEAITLCYNCLRQGKGVMTMDTEFGMVSWEEASARIVPIHPDSDFADTSYEVVSLEPGPDYLKPIQAHDYHITAQWESTTP